MTDAVPVPDNEAERVNVVKSLGLLNTPPEERFDRYTRFARQLMGAPIAYVSIVGADTQWFKSAQGIDAHTSDRTLSFCTHTIIEDRLMVVEDALEDARFASNPFVVGDPYIRFYLGVKLNVHNDVCIGTLCVCDTKPRYPSDGELSHLVELSKLLEDEFQAHAQSTTDPLTGLSNRRGFETIGSHILALCQRTERAATLMYVHLDDFKAMNVEFGREAGDQVLIDIGQLLLAEFRNSDVVARVGASDFFILLTGTSAVDLSKPVQNLAGAIKEENMNLAFELSYKVGAVEYDPERHADAEALMAEASEAMAADT
ncbi:MAG: sensor domain-containing diguanylate cyclase [Gammaproteobacteria bacterium]|jgi:diguanylate cyclase (GGDEF)-like protein|nr:sensor domain-containing diguanylate cyclase [Gammaproteobacteria bacterium]MBT4492335.1 sensor domain-containing diguanylate cyclase [Gammaproteobacteria bacterium]MBT7371410.1 sensor domain-containing diguanylate cyclase [Gammaproteobacteria bacterium]